MRGEYYLSQGVQGQARPVPRMEDTGGGRVPGPEEDRGRAGQAGDLALQSDLVTLVSVQYRASGDTHHC